MKYTKETIELIEVTERDLDMWNSENGTKDQLCVFCGSDKYDGFSGIIHKQDCIIKHMRDWIFIARNSEKS